MATKAMTNSSASVYSIQPHRRGRESDWAVHRLIVQNPDYAWSDAVIGKLEELMRLPKGWDGYSGRSVDFSIAYFAANLLQAIYVPGAPCPSLVPGSDGTLQIEWHSAGLDIELDILGANKVECVMADINTGDEEEAKLTVDFKIVRVWIDEMAKRAADAVPAAA
ncbi:hypothetical protein MesoLj113a_34880 [Mesorhizobium sp. 113-1-2]|uniref:hypothetical protein n=1 Tax=Mesorhizobium sp. 113-1-2 TaxID=2744515 RepID=UPI0008198D98|nr:hypothetical protein [Mesorhizobium sp. 113-1-2]BAV46422.1 Putative uncharacterized protein [Mesorhizobium loti]BCG72330.1 hypothetical protein MesoLj113a_34880 [Mesorhizobium sp. 113-1-2]